MQRSRRVARRDSGSQLSVHDDRIRGSFGRDVVPYHSAQPCAAIALGFGSSESICSTLLSSGSAVPGSWASG